MNDEVLENVLNILNTAESEDDLDLAVAILYGQGYNIQKYWGIIYSKLAKNWAVSHIEEDILYFYKDRLSFLLAVDPKIYEPQICNTDHLVKKYKI